jgi:hypothetical protein
MPAWAAIVIGLGSGVAGTLLSISHQRGSEFRTRMLDAAASFLDHAEAIRRVVRSPRGAGITDPIVAIRDRWDDLVPHVMMVELLFGTASAPAQLARAAGGTALDVIEQIEAFAASPLEPPPNLDAAAKLMAEQLNAFASAAADQVRDTWLRKHLTRARTVDDYAPRDPFVDVH